MPTKKILFIAWDGPYVNYLDGLFLPIFYGLKKYGYEFHIMHFSWADSKAIEKVINACRKKDVPYVHYPIHTRPHPVVGKYVTLKMAGQKVIRYLKKEGIDIVMPRTMMPASMVIQVRRKLPLLKIVFDADGLPIEERVDFAGLIPGSFRYRQLKKIEANIIRISSLVITRSAKATEFLIQQYGEAMRPKFYRVINGRDEELFKKSMPAQIAELRSLLGIPPDALVLVYCGSLGPQYGVPEMAKLHEAMWKHNSNSYWLVLTGNAEYMKPYSKLPNVIVRKVSAVEVPAYLSVANVGLALRKATFSMQGVAPIKLGEYLLTGLPVIASAGIGDTDVLLTDHSYCFVLNDLTNDNIEKAFHWAKNQKAYMNVPQIRDLGIRYFSLHSALASYDKALSALD